MSDALCFPTPQPPWPRPRARFAGVAALAAALIVAGCTGAESSANAGRGPASSVGEVGTVVSIDGAGSAAPAEDGAPPDGGAERPTVATGPPKRPDPAVFTEGRAKLVAAGVPDLAAKAYLNASARVADVDPRCVVPPEVLAAFGRQESNHGRVAEWDEMGRSRTILRGYAETGPDTDDGELDGDKENDWAVGAMQFIPTTWKAYAQDGDGDGRAEPGNFYDAALTSAWHICDLVGPFPSPSVVAAQWASFDTQYRYAEAAFKEQKRLYDYRFERHTVLAFQVIADPENQGLQNEFNRWPHPGKEPSFTPPPTPAGAAVLITAAERYYGPEGEVRDDYVASISSEFRSIAQATGDVPYGDLDRVSLR